MAAEHLCGEKPCVALYTGPLRRKWQIWFCRSGVGPKCACLTSVPEMLRLQKENHILNGPELGYTEETSNLKISEG